MGDIAESTAASADSEWGATEARDWIAVPQPDDDKYSRGVLGVLTGSNSYPGAAVLGVEAAARAGVGMIRYLGPSRASDLVLTRRPEVVTAPGRVQAWLLGSGMDPSKRDDATAAALRSAIAEELPLVIDAGALDLVPQTAGPTVVTPHYRELSSLLRSNGVDAPVDAIRGDPASWALRAATTLGVVVLLKGNTTWMASPDAERIRVHTGPAWLATAGTGDVLAGILGSVLATHSREIAEQGHSAVLRCAATACVVHGLAAQRSSGGGPIVALDVAVALPATIAALLS